MYYKGTQQECIDYDVFVTQNENYFQNDNWANPIEREGSYYILKHEDYEAEIELVEELPQVDIEEI
tara:strand:+ start:303 stop:500 length:198 start_codon:yes stop_codon:yes gene_type:complete